MVRALQVHHFKPDRFPVEMLLVPKKYINLDLANGARDRPGTMPWNTVRVGMSCFVLTFSFSMVSRYRMLMLLPPSISTQENQAACLSVARVASKTNA